MIDKDIERLLEKAAALINETHDAFKKSIQKERVAASNDLNKIKADIKSAMKTLDNIKSNAEKIQKSYKQPIDIINDGINTVEQRIFSDTSNDETTALRHVRSLLIEIRETIK